MRAHVHLLHAGSTAEQVLGLGSCITPHSHRAAPPCLLQDVTNLIQDSITGQEAQRLASARAASAIVYHATAIATREGEEGAAAVFAKLQLELLKAFDPKCVQLCSLYPPDMLA